MKAGVQKKTEALGGRYSTHLTKECTHLIAGTIAKSPKYKVKSRQRDNHNYIFKYFSFIVCIEI